MKEIKLSGKLGEGKVALIDDVWFDELSKYKWSAVIKDNCIYARRSWATNENGKQKFHATLMHRLIMEITDSKVYVDHIDGDGLNNQSVNLRIANSSQNGANRRAKSNGTSKYLGVHKHYNGWMAQCSKDNEQHQKYFSNEKDAALYYNTKALEFHGEFAKLNIIENE